MSLPRLVRGTTVLACAAFAATAVVAPAHAAAPAFVAAPAFSAFTSVPASPAIPSTDDIAQAKKSEVATAAESAKIDALLGSANERLQGSLSGTIRANSAYTDALVALDQRRTEATQAKAQADAAAKQYKTAKAHLGALAGNLYKTGGMNLDVQALIGSTSADNAMYQASTLMALSTDRANTFDTAAAASASSTALQAQAAAAQKAADDAARLAEQSKLAAQSATDALAAVVKENQAQRDVLLKQLASLHNTTVALEGARVDGLAKKAQEAALQAQIAASTRAPAPVAPAAPAAPAQSAPSQPQPAQPKPAAPPVAPPVVPVAPPAPPVVPPAPPVVPPVIPPAPPVAPPAPTQPTGSYIQTMVNFALSKSGTPYQWGGTGPVGYDCSGLVQQAFAAAGVSVPRTGTEQFWAAPQRVPLSQMRYGDLLVFDESPAGSGSFGHIAIYLGNDQVVQALSPGFATGVYSISSMLQFGMTLYPYAARY